MSELSNSSSIRACLMETDNTIDGEVVLEVGSKNKVQSEGDDIGTDIEDFSEESLLDFSYGSGELYSPESADSDTSITDFDRPREARRNPHMNN